MPKKTTCGSQTISQEVPTKKTRKGLSKCKKERESIVLLSNKTMQRFFVFLDEEIGLPIKFQDTVLESVSFSLK
jgi:hypothetical protein